MFSEKFIEYLDKELEQLQPKWQVENRKMFKKLGFNEKNQDFVDFWSVYSDEIYGNEGYLTDLASDLEEFDCSQTQFLHEEFGAPKNYISFFGDEYDDYMIYDRNTDEVFFIEAENISLFFKEKYCDKRWSSFASFIQDFLGFIE